MATFTQNLTVTASGGINAPGLLWHDEFDTLSLWDYNNPGNGGTWQPGATGPGSNAGTTDSAFTSWELNPFNPQTPFGIASKGTPIIYSVSNSILTINIDKTPAAYASACGNQPYVTGILNASQAFNRQYGYIEVKASLPNFAGVGGSFWLLTSNHVWPPEIDINEFGEPVSAGQTPTGQDYAHPLAVIDNGTTWPVDQYFQMSLGWHNYALDWRADGCDFYIDGVVKNSGSPTPSILQQSMYFIIQVNSGVSSTFSNGEIQHPEQLPQAYQVDYVRWWDSRQSYLNAGLP